MNKLMLTAVAAAVAFSVAVPAQAAALLGVKAGVDVWAANAKINSSTNDKSDDTSPSFYVAFEHFIPLVPNFRLRYNDIDTGAVAFEQTDLTAYYEILDNDAIAFDLGLTMTKFGSGNVTLGGQNDTFDEWQPSIYGNVEVGIPMTPLAIFGDLNFSNFNSNSTVDGLAGVKWTVPLVALDLNVRGGYRVMDYDFDSVKNSDSVKLDGWFAGVELDF
ncbi:TIGR04219 family outer membrane beta-barrel protein [Photobacterium frigidiphilum]|uniref:TIGR04219 family outer membrane beta-barrel protein n=1 Tax=Photobacterium frigidiphilum TaxID=264736 RepID=UPI003D0B1D16